jgi:hypothetical protein
MPNLKHCRILMCRAGAADESISSKQLELYEKKHKNDPESASIMQVWDSKDPTSLPYDENTLASAFWHKLFISPEKWMTEDTDFALTVASSVIVPEVSRPKYSEGFFKVHDPENLKHENQLLASKYITVVTPASSKLQERLVEHNHYLPVK